MSSITTICVILAVIGFFIVRFFKWLLGKEATPNSASSDHYSHSQGVESVEYDSYNDGSEYCFYDLPEESQHCVNCDLAEECRGWSIHDEDEDDDRMNHSLFGSIFRDIDD